MSIPIYLVVDERKLHRGFLDRSGRFTLEQCNISTSNEADNLKTLYEADVRPEGFDDLDRCEHCFPDGVIEGVAEL